MLPVLVTLLGAVIKYLTQTRNDGIIWAPSWKVHSVPVGRHGGRSGRWLIAVHLYPESRKMSVSAQLPFCFIQFKTLALQIGLVRDLPTLK